MSESDSDESEMYCERHGLEEPAYQSHDPHCPRCRQEDRIERARAEASFVGHNMHPSVDARRR